MTRFARRRRNAQHENRRAGVSLTEVLLAGSISLIILSMMTGILHRAFRNERTSINSTSFQTMSQRIAYRFRNDVGQNPNCELRPNGLKLSGSSGSVTYTTEQNVLHRRAIGNVDDSTVHTDQFELPDVCRLDFQILSQDENRKLDIAQLFITFDNSIESPTQLAGDSGLPTKRIVIEAAVGTSLHAGVSEADHE